MMHCLASSFTTMIKEADRPKFVFAFKTFHISEVVNSNSLTTQHILKGSGREGKGKASGAVSHVKLKRLWRGLAPLKLCFPVTLNNCADCVTPNS